MKCIVFFGICLFITVPASGQNWGSFRGPNATGVADGQRPPQVWDAEKSLNIAWKTPIPGLGHSSPVVWGDRIFITTAVSSATNPDFVHGLTETAASANDTSKQSWRILCLDRRSGKVIWERVAREGEPVVRRHVKASYANSTPATDGKYLVVFFGSEGLYCYDLDGRQLWKQQLGVLDGGWSASPDFHFGFASSPIIFRNLAIVQCDTQNQSFIVAFNLTDGKEVWRTSRGEDTSWSTPTIVQGKNRVELIASGTRFYRGYDPLNGKELWRLADGVDVKIATPIAAGDLYFLGGGSSQGKRTFYAVRSGASGEISTQSSGNQIVWQSPVIKPHIVTPIVYGDYLYVCTDNGILTQYQARTGEPGYRARLGPGGSFSASPVASDGNLYFTSEDGDVFVVRAGPEYQLIAKNPVGEVVMATPAITAQMIILRGQHHVFAITQQSSVENGTRPTEITKK